jgi:hypothetical protein
VANAVNDKILAVHALHRDAGLVESLKRAAISSVRLDAHRRLLILHRRHLKTKMRDAAQDVSIYRGALPQASSVSLAAQLLGRLTSPSHAAMRAEMQLRLQEALNSMDPLARSLPQLAQMRARLRPRMVESPMCQADRFATQFANALRQVWRYCCSSKNG